MVKLRILGIPGSLRKNSYNKSILLAAKELAPKDVEIEIFDLEGIPLFNQDIEKNLPKRVKELKDRIENSDAVLIATPEYNYSVPGVLKNAIDWASRPSGKSSWNEKPVAIMSASEGAMGGSRAQYHLRQTLTALNMQALAKPEVIVTFVTEKLDGDGRLVDEKTRDKISELVKALVVLTKKLK